jgi:hypothetical protein
MGNAYALKIKKINDNNLLKDIVFNNEQRIVEYIYFITKINKFYVENFRRGSIISDFTICNIFNRKEHNIVIDRVEAGYFFEGLEYSIEYVPSIEKVLIISKVIENTVSYDKQIRPNVTMILGNDKNYFSKISDIENELTNKNANFIFYDFENEKIFSINFEDFREADGKLTMGFEVQEINVNQVMCYRKNKFNTKENEVNLINKTNGFSNIKLSEERKANGINDITDYNYKTTFTGNSDITADLSNQDKILNTNNSEMNILEKIDIAINPVNQTNMIEEPDLIECSNNSKDENDESNDEYIKIEDVSTNHKNNKFSKNSSSENIKLEENNVKYNFFRAKKKYNKYLSIYDKVDSNFNFMNIAKKAIRKIISNIIEDKIKVSEILNVNEENAIKKENKVILIKGFYLNKSDETDYSCLKICEMNENTREKII